MDCVFKTRVIFFREIIYGHEGPDRTIQREVFKCFKKRTKENQTIIKVDLNQEKFLLPEIVYIYIQLHI